MEWILGRGFRRHPEDESDGTMKTARAISVALFAVLSLAPAAGADTMDSYTGLPFDFASGEYTRPDRVSGYFVTASLLDVPWRTDIAPMVLRYSFTDGHETLTEANSTFWEIGGVEQETVKW